MKPGDRQPSRFGLAVPHENSQRTRRWVVCGLILSGAQFCPPRFSNAQSLSGSILKSEAISGHQFKRGDASFALADLIGPIKHDLHPGASRFADEARAMLGDAINQRDWGLLQTGQTTRWGHKIVRSQGGELERILIRRGAVRVLPTTQAHDMIAALLEAEQHARSSQAGLWGHSFYRVRDANIMDDCRDTIGAWQALAGRVMSVGQSRQRTYLNFGEDYRNDVTVTVPGALSRAWLRDGFDLSKLDQHLIRVRGYIEWINGPSIEVRHPQEIELLNEEGAGVMKHPLL